MRRLVLHLMALCWLMLVAAAPSWAHKVNLFAYVEGDRVFVEGYFPDGKKVEGGAIQVLDGAGVLIAKGTTDQQGQYSFPLVKKEDLTLLLDAGLGHKTQYMLPKSEM